MTAPFIKEDYLEDLGRRANLVTADERYITLHGPNDFNYEIERNRCDTPLKILQWIRHLSEKTWVTTEIIDRFIQVCGRANGIDVFGLEA